MWERERERERRSVRSKNKGEKHSLSRHCLPFWDLGFKFPYIRIAACWKKSHLKTIRRFWRMLLWKVCRSTIHTWKFKTLLREGASSTAWELRTSNSMVSHLPVFSIPVLLLYDNFAPADYLSSHETDEIAKRAQLKSRFNMYHMSPPSIQLLFALRTLSRNWRNVSKRLEGKKNQDVQHPRDV